MLPLSNLSRLGPVALFAVCLTGCPVPDAEVVQDQGTSGGEVSGAGAVGLRPGLSVRGTTVGAGDHIQFSCGGPMVGTSDVSFVFTPPADGTYTFVTHTDYDGTLAVYEGPTEVACNDDNESTRSSRLVLPLRGGVAYRVIVDGYTNQEGSFELSVSDPLTPPPPGVAAGGVLSVGGSVRGATSLSIDTHVPSCGAGRPGTPDAVYRFIAPEDANYVFSTSSDYDAVLVLYEGSNELQCNDDFNDTAHSRVSATLRQGQMIDVVVDGFAGNMGSFELSVARVVLQPPQQLAAGQDARGSTVGAGDAYTPDCGSQPGTPDQVWRFTPQMSGSYRFHVDSDYDGVLAVYAANQLILCNDDAGTTRASEVIGPLQAGQTYDVVVDGYGRSEGNYVLRADFGVGPSIPGVPGGIGPTPPIVPNPATPQPIQASIHGGPLPENITAMEARCTAATPITTGHYSIDMQGESAARLSCGSGGAGADGLFVIDIAQTSLVSVHAAADFPIGVELRRGCSRDQEALSCNITTSPSGVDFEQPLVPGRYVIVVDSLDGVARGVAHLDVNIRPAS